MFRFKAELACPPGVGTWTYVPVPKSVTAKPGTTAQVRITGDIDGAPVASTLMADGEGGHYLVVAKPVRTSIGKEAGANVQVSITVASGPPEIEIPAKLKAALAKDPAAKRIFDALAPSHKREHVTHVDEAKKPETRERRATKTIEMLRACAT